MRLGNFRTFVHVQVGDNLPENAATFFEVPESVVAIGAEQGSIDPGSVVVIDVQGAALRPTVRRKSADGAKPTLRLEHGFVLRPAEIVQLLTQRVFSVLTVIASVIPGDRPFLRARFAVVPLAIRLAGMGREVIQLANLLAQRTDLFVGRQLRKSSALFPVAPQKVLNRFDAAEAADDRLTRTPSGRRWSRVLDILRILAAPGTMRPDLSCGVLSFAVGTGFVNPCFDVGSFLGIAHKSDYTGIDSECQEKGGSISESSVDGIGLN